MKDSYLVTGKKDYEVLALIKTDLPMFCKVAAKADFDQAIPYDGDADEGYLYIKNAYLHIAQSTGRVSIIIDYFVVEVFDDDTDVNEFSIPCLGLSCDDLDSLLMRVACYVPDPNLGFGETIDNAWEEGTIFTKYMKAYNKKYGTKEDK